MQRKDKFVVVCMAGLVVLIAVGTFVLRAEREKDQIAEADRQWREGTLLRYDGPENDKNGQEESVPAEPPAIFSEDTVSFQGKTYRRNTYIKAILGLGIDRNGTLEESQVAGSGGQSDSIVLIAQDTVHDTVKLLMIPRDTMTDIVLTDLTGDELGWDKQHLTLAYAYGDGREKSLDYSERAVSRMFGGFPLDGGLAIDMDALPVINDAVGGVEVLIDDEDLAARDPEFHVGERIRLKGKQAETFLRYRNIEKSLTALKRQERQKQYIEGFTEAIKKKAGEKQGFVAGLYDETQPYLVTDLKKDQVLDMLLTFVKSGQGIGDDDMVTLPGTAAETDLFDEYHMDQDAAYELILNLFFREE